MSEFYYIVTIEHLDEADQGEALEAAGSFFSFEGELDYQLDEAQIDLLLGKEAYCGGEIPEDVLQKLDHNQKDASKRYFFKQKEEALSFHLDMKEKGYKTFFSEEPIEDWNQKWRENFKEIVVDDHLKIIPSWEKVGQKQDDVYIYPGMGFGTGNHETTFLCLKLFRELQTQKLLKQGLDCLDFGCGSGILGIAGIKQIGAIVDFVDIDPDALDNCVQNLELNHFEPFPTGHGLILRERFKNSKEYELGFANILESVLELEKNQLLTSLKNQGFLIVSGLLNDQVSGIIKSYSELKHLRTISKGDWSAILFQKGV